MSTNAPLPAFGALAGLKVIDLSRVLGGPYSGQILADHGARVIKVEPPAGDETRAWGPPFAEDGTAAYYNGLNRNKRDIVIDLSRPEGREIVLKMLADADVLIENFKIGTLDRWGIGYEQTLRERFPRLIHCRVSGFGADGPLGGAPGYDAVAQALGGLMSVNGTPDSGPLRVGVPVVDITTGLSAVIGVLLALVERQRSGRGQFVEATLYDTAVSLLHPQSANWLQSGQTPQLSGNAHSNIVPYDKFATQTCEIFLGIGNNGQWKKLCAFLGCPEMADEPRFATNADRFRERDALRTLLEAYLLQVDGEQLCRDLLAVGIPAGAVRSIPQVLTDPHTLHRDMVVQVEGVPGIGIPVKLSRTPGRAHSAPPRFGQHTRELLLEHGYGAATIDAMIARGTVVEYVVE
ncbi:CaiB/BaiF CoA transferase family protein [Polaromonas sp. JS666]|uniref:CaiB/BaiF CoA transferase family protein n=1 Tax=Polaromonas sp. (strain JS666 / ATCC BAA-500) TaxID=296591 RepID=UPI00004646CB|nr:CaiB/BaiF CoA-transferase family protein [Polaromonas sp. JS666]ABE47144.1 L-carnitine dehydratase/bile acid-inducible protein F [Polaromonas sp. JS666]